MSIRIISVKGKVVGYQAIVGVGGPGMSAYVSARHPGAWDEAAKKAAELQDLHRAILQAKRNPLRGFKVTSRVSTNQPGKVLLSVRCQWKDDGKTKGTSFSVQTHGALDAVALAMRAYERNTKRRIGMSPQAVKAMLFSNLNN